MNLCPFKLYRVYLEPLIVVKCKRLFLELNSYNKGFIHVQIEKGKFVVVCPRFHKRSHWEVSRRSRAVDVKEMY